MTSWTSVRTYVRPSAPPCMPMWPVSHNHITGSSLELIDEAILQFTAYIFDIGHQSYGQLTPVKTRYPLTSITWPYPRLKLDLFKVTCFFEGKRRPGTGCWLDCTLKPGQTLTPERGLIFLRSFCGSTRLHGHAMSAKLLTVDAFRVQVRFGKYIFLAFFAGFNPGLT